MGMINSSIEKYNSKSSFSNKEFTVYHCTDYNIYYITDRDYYSNDICINPNTNN